MLFTEARYPRTENFQNRIELKLQQYKKKFILNVILKEAEEVWFERMS